MTSFASAGLVMKTRKQLVTLAVGAAWVSGAALLSDDGLQFAAFASPGVAAALLCYAAFSHRFRSLTLGITAAMVAWVSIALFVGKSDCCATEQQYRYLQHYPSNLAGDFIRLHGFDGEVQVKPPAAVMLEILQLSISRGHFGPDRNMVGWQKEQRKIREARVGNRALPRESALP